MYLGIEIGGTKLQLGLGQGDGKLAGLWRGTVQVEEGPEGIRRQILRAVPELLAQSGQQAEAVAAVGIGFGGPIDDRTQTVIKSHQIPGWDNFPLAEWIGQLLGKPAVLGNDADVAGLAEALVGAGRGVSPVFYITVGSGIGGGLIIDGQIYRGCGRGAAEIGHLRVPAPGTSPPADLPLEEVASGWAIGRAAEQALRLGEGKEGVLARLVGGAPERASAPLVAQAAAQGDPLAQRILAQAVRALSRAIREVITLLCPRRIVIGGGVSQMGDALFFAPLKSLVSQTVSHPFAIAMRLCPRHWVKKWWCTARSHWPNGTRGCEA